VPYKPKKPKAKFKPNQTAPELYKIEKMEEVYLREYVHAITLLYGFKFYTV
jgi:hypothetical protein